MIILSISKLNNKMASGPNINVPIFVKKLNESANCESGYLDVGDCELENFKNYKNYFKFKDYKNFTIESLPIPFNKPDIVVFQDLYHVEFIQIAKELNRRNIPYTIVPRCSMTKEAQRYKKIKKVLANLLLFNKFVKNALFIHFLTENEYIESKKAFYFRDYVVVGNGVNLPNKYYSIKERNEFQILFIGRYNVFHKGLDVLLESVLIGREYFEEKNIKIVLYGRDSNNGLEFLEHFVLENNLSNIIKVYGEIFGEEKERALLDSDCFIHTSRLEGHPTSVIEAISYGIPVIVTPGTNVKNTVEDNNLGFTCELEKERVFECIKSAYETKKDFNHISYNEIEFAKKNYDWNMISKDIIKKYKTKLQEKN